MHARAQTFETRDLAVNPSSFSNAVRFTVDTVTLAGGNITGPNPSEASNSLRLTYNVPEAVGRAPQRAAAQPTRAVLECFHRHPGLQHHVLQQRRLRPPAHLQPHRPLRLRPRIVRTVRTGCGGARKRLVSRSARGRARAWRRRAELSFVSVFITYTDLAGNPAKQSPTIFVNVARVTGPITLTNVRGATPALAVVYASSANASVLSFTATWTSFVRAAAAGLLRSRP
jgi:hypothetical protein